MKIRQYKRYKSVLMQISAWMRDPTAWPAPSRPVVPEQDLPACPAAPILYKVARMKDNVIVLETFSAEEAQEAIDKAARQKKAKLVLVEGHPFEQAA